jgi:hypothetical protein
MEPSAVPSERSESRDVPREATHTWGTAWSEKPYKNKGPTSFDQALCPFKEEESEAKLRRINRGSDLLSHAVAHTVPSAVAGLTSVFGMGTGVTLLL